MKKKIGKIVKIIFRPAVIWTFLGVFFTVYMTVHMVKDFAPTLATSPAIAYSENVTLNGEGYIFRKETLLTAEPGGYTDYKVKNGAYAKAGTELAVRYSIPDDEEVKKLCARLDEVNLRIEFLSENSLRLGSGGISDTLDSVKNDYTAYTAALAVGDTSGAMKYAGSFAGRLFTLSENSGREVDASLEKTKKEIIELTEERQEIYALLSGYPSTSITAPTTGNFFRGSDGLEYTFTTVDSEELTLGAYFELFESGKPSSDDASSVGRFIGDTTWYFAFPTTMSEAARFSTGSTYDVSFDASRGSTLGMTLERIVSEGTDTRALLIFSSEALPEGFGVGRRRSASITVRRYSGYRVPSAAISGGENDRGVWILSSGAASRRSVKVLLDRGNYCIVEPLTGDAELDYGRLEQNDIVIVTDERLYEGKLIN